MGDVRGVDVRERTVTANGIRMHVTEAGNGAPVVLLHGFPESSREYARVLPALAPRAHVIAPDLRGAGRTEAPARGYDLQTVVSDVVGLLDELKIQRTAIVAHDWSALVAFELCLTHPELVSRLVAIAVPAPYIRMTPALAWGMAKAMPHLWFQYAVAMPGLGPRLLSGGAQRLPSWMLRSFEGRPIPDDDVAAYLAALREPARARAGSALYRHLILPAFGAIMRGAYRGRRLTVPTLVLFGADDALLPRDAMTVSADDAPDLSIEFVPGGGHFLVDDQPDEVARRIGEFLNLPVDLPR